MTINHSCHPRICVYLGQPSIRALNAVIQVRQKNRGTHENNHHPIMKINPRIGAL